MALTERIQPAQTCIRHTMTEIDSTHHQCITEMLKDGVLVSAQVGDPQAPSLVDDDNGLSLVAAIGQMAATALTENQSIKCALTVEQHAHEQTRTALARAVAELNATQADLAAARTLLAQRQARPVCALMAAAPVASTY